VPGDVVFTSGGTEADNLAVSGVAAGAGTVLCSAVEHPAVLQASLAAGGAPSVWTIAVSWTSERSPRYWTKRFDWSR